MNKQNNRYWSNKNPHWTVETNYPTILGIHIWCGLIGGHLIGPYFYNGRRYLNFLFTYMPTMLENDPLFFDRIELLHIT